MTLTPEVTILSRKQQNKSLSAKKKPQKTIRNILTSKNSSFWPVLEDNTLLVTELEFLKFKKSIKKKDVLKVTEPSTMEVDADDECQLRKTILFGVNEVAKCLKNNECLALIFDAEVPRILVQHLIHMASSKQVPITGVSGLTNIILTIFGFKSSTICFKTEPSNKFSKIIDLIKRLCPVDCTWSTRESAPIEINVVNQVKGHPPLKPSQTSAGVIYLYRKTKKERAFVPPSLSKVLMEPEEQKDTANFIKIKGANRNVVKKSNAKFKPLLVNKIQNNINRPKKKNAK